MRFPIPGQPERHPPAELFGKTEFLAFIDNILYTVNAYHFKASVEDMELSPDKSSAILTLSVNASAHGVSSALGEMSSQFTTSGTCHAKALFDPQAKPTLGIYPAF